MAKNIVFCADGTWNGPPGKTGVSAVDDDADANGEVPKSEVTNVVRLFANLEGQGTPETLKTPNEQEKVAVDANGKVIQVAKYIHGVGDSENVVKKVLGGVFGLGIVSRVVRGFTFISRNYQPGDAIQIVGFSRGAYTARALAGMIAKVGLLNPAKYDPKDKSQSYRYGVAAWAQSKSLSLNGAGKLTTFANSLLNIIETFVGSTLPKDGLIPDVKIRTVGVWDTVGSLGIPAYAADTRFDVYRFTDTALSTRVELGFHAMAIDELRRDFPVTRWDARDGIEQVWFAGAHADVGGGYLPVESRLSDIGLSWMMKKLADRSKVLFAARITPPLDPKSVGQAGHTPWLTVPFEHFPQSPREVLATDAVHASVVEKWRQDTAPLYRPSSMGKLKPDLSGVVSDAAMYP